MININKTKKYLKIAQKKLTHQFSTFLYYKFGVLNPVPLKVYYTVSNTCNFKCIMCPHWRMPQDDQGLYISDERMFGLIDEMAQLGIGEFGVSGGEPLIFRERIFKFLEYANRKGLYTHFVTNGSLLTVDDVRRYDSIGGGHISLSIDGIGEKHDYLRGFPGAFSKIEKALEIFKNEQFKNVNLKINTVLSNENIDQVLKIIDLTIEAGAMIFIQPYDIYDFSGKYDLAARQEKFPLWIKKESLEKLKNVINRIVELKKQHPQIILNDLKHLSAMLSYFQGKNDLKNCYAIADHLIINPLGEVAYCKYGKVFDLKTGGIKEFLQSNIRKNILKDSYNCKTGCLLGCQFRPSFYELFINAPKQFLKLIK